MISSVKQLSNKNTCELKCIYLITKQPLHGEVKSLKPKLTTVRVNITNSKNKNKNKNNNENENENENENKIKGKNKNNIKNKNKNKNRNKNKKNKNNNKPHNNFVNMNILHKSIQYC